MNGALYWEKGKITQKYFVAMQEAEREKHSLKEQIYKGQKEKEKSVQTVAQLEKEYSALKDQYEKVEGRYDGAIDLKNFLETKFTEIANAAADGRGKIDTISKQLDKQLAELSEINAFFGEGRTKSKTRSYARSSAADSVNLPPVVVKEKKEKTGEGKEETLEDERQETNATQIMSVNEEHNFVVINKGLVDGIAVGKVFNVKRQGQDIGVVAISEARDFVALGIIKKVKKGFFIQEGDILS